MGFWSFWKSPVTLTVKTNNFENTLSIESADHFERMIDSFSNELKNPGTASYNFEDDLLNQAKVMDGARISYKEKRYVEINEIQ